MEGSIFKKRRIFINNYRWIKFLKIKLPMLFLQRIVFDLLSLYYILPSLCHQLRIISFCYTNYHIDATTSLTIINQLNHRLLSLLKSRVSSRLANHHPLRPQKINTQRRQTFQRCIKLRLRTTHSTLSVYITNWNIQPLECRSTSPDWRRRWRVKYLITLAYQESYIDQ